MLQVSIQIDILADQAFEQDGDILLDNLVNVQYQRLNLLLATERQETLDQCR